MALFESKESKAKVLAAEQKRDTEKAAHVKTKKELSKVKGELEVANEEIEAKKKVNDILKEYKDLHEQNMATKIKLDEREKLLDAKAKAQDTFKEEITKLQEQVTQAEDRGYKKGYADGVSDGVRKGMDATKDDRKMMAQIAALAASSHSSEANNVIAREVANGIARDLNELPATTKSKNK